MRHRNFDLDSKSWEAGQMIIKCEKGKHYYETERHTSCPFCLEVEKQEKIKVNEAADMGEEKTTYLTETK